MPEYILMFCGITVRDRSKPRLLLVWHEAGNRLYHDRFVELSRRFDLTVLGPDRFQGAVFLKGEPAFDLRLYPAIFTHHWLTFISFGIWFYVLRNPRDILYIHEEPHSLMAFLLSLLKGRSTIFLESSAINFKGNFRRWNVLERFVYWRADCVLPKNPEVGEILVRRGCSRAKIAEPVGNGVSRSSFDVIEKAKARAELAARHPQLNDFVSTNLVVGYAGRIWTAKGLDLFVDLARQPGIMLIVCGEVFDDDLAQRLAGAGVTIYPKLGKNDLRSFYAALDLFVLPSLSTPGWREQFGRVCIEAIFSGTPAIGSAIGGIPMVIGADQTFPPGDHAAAMAMVDGLRHPTARHMLLMRQEAYVEQRFTWASIARQIDDLYRSLQ